MEKQYQGK